MQQRVRGKRPGRDKALQKQEKRIYICQTHTVRSSQQLLVVFQVTSGPTRARPTTDGRCQREGTSQKRGSKREIEWPSPARLRRTTLSGWWRLLIAASHIISGGEGWGGAQKTLYAMSLLSTRTLPNVNVRAYCLWRYGLPTVSSEKRLLFGNQI